MAYDRYARGGDNPFRLDIDTLDMPKAQPVARRDRVAEATPPRRPKKKPDAPVTSTKPPQAFPNLPSPPDVGPVDIPGPDISTEPAAPLGPSPPFRKPIEVATEPPTEGTIMDPQFRTDLPPPRRNYGPAGPQATSLPNIGLTGQGAPTLEPQFAPQGQYPQPLPSSLHAWLMSLLGGYDARR